MVIDTSAIVAWLRDEPEAQSIEDAIVNAAGPPIMSALSVYETYLVLKRRFAGADLPRFDAFIENVGLDVRAFDRRQAELAFAAFQRFGQGSGHPAKLNLGDCAAYALGRSLELPLLFKGNDFIHTDVRPVMPARPAE